MEQDGRDEDEQSNDSSVASSSSSPLPSTSDLNDTNDTVDDDDDSQSSQKRLNEKEEPTTSTSNNTNKKNKKQKTKNETASTYLTSSMFHINQEAMLELADDVLDPELRLLGVTSFSQNAYEQELIGQLEKAIEQKAKTTDKSSAECTEEEEESSTRDSSLTQPTDTEVEDNISTSETEQLDSKEIAHFIESDDDDEEESDLVIDDDDVKTVDDEAEEPEEPEDPNDKDYIVDLADDDDELDDKDDAVPDYEPIRDCLDDDVDQFEEAPESCFVPRKKKWPSVEMNLKKNNNEDKCRSSSEAHKKKIADDGDERLYRTRVAQYRLYLAEERLDIDEQYNELYQINDQLRIPKRVWDRLFTHQQESLRWLWGLHVDMCGGIIGDEMGLGKTIQVIAYLVALKHTTYREVGHLYPTLGPVLLICPATVMHQWVHEFHSWWPPFRVAILHSTSSYRGRDKKKLVREVFKSSGVLITTYQGICMYDKLLTEFSWHYVVLDEGHKIRNPQAQVTHCCKLLKTPHRIILSGSPIQNNLQELWSLFDFIYPGKLGQLTTFMNTVAHPIRRGGYTCATELQIQIAYKCTLMLRESIKPYLLRRTKDDVKSALNLPSKNEQVLFCKLTDVQRDMYTRFISSGFIRDISRGQAQVFAALIKIRKICNHPFLFHPFNVDPTFNRDFFEQSGKMAVVNALLKLWHKQKHKVLLFTQSRQMLDLLEKFMQVRQYEYLRMDGQTTIASRQGLIRDFNTNPVRFIFLLTTKVGGIGVNLIGADRVIIYDPDWNPCTDIQARERCWRIGQNKDVIIYRLLTAGTVEEKIYHRQIYKQYLTNSVLKNPNHRRFFKINDLRELFTLSEINETSLMFADSKVKFGDDDKSKDKSKHRVKLHPSLANQSSTKGRLMSSSTASKMPKIPRKNEPNPSSSPNTKVNAEPVEVTLSDERRQQLKDRAKLLSQQIAAKFANKEVTGTGTKPEQTKDKPNQNQNIKPLPLEPITKPITKPSTDQQQPSPSKPKQSSSSKNKDNNTNKKEGIKFEGKRIKYLVAQEAFEEDGEKRDKKKKKHKKNKKARRESKDNSNKKEDYILKNLLGSSIDVVLQHDTIENVNVPDHFYLEREAEKIAKEAIESLQHNSNSSGSRSRTQTDEHGLSVTIQRNIDFTDTNRSKLLGTRTISGPLDKNSNKFSSANMIAAMRAKQGISTSRPVNGFFAPDRASTSNPSSSSSSSSSSSTPTNRYLENNKMLEELCNFVHHRAARQNEATTNEILNHFKGRLAPERCSIFKSMLQSLCERTRNDEGLVVWMLKNDFKNL